MENIKKNPILMGILSAVGCEVLLLAVEFVLGLTTQKPFSVRISEPLTIIILIVGPVSCFISTFGRTKKKIEGEEKKEL